MKTVIVGGVAGGATAAARIRRLDETAEIVLFERSSRISCANCGLPYYIGGVITDAEELTLQTPESFRVRYRIDVRVRHEVTALHPEAKTVTVRRLEDGTEFEESYETLLLAPGARPILPAVSGLDSDRVFTLRTVEDTLQIRSFLKEKKPRSVILAGGGFISLELADNLLRQGLDVTIVQRPQQLLSPLDADMAGFLHAEMRSRGVHLLLGQAVEGIETDAAESGGAGSVRVLLQGGDSLQADMVVLAIGVTPDTRLAKDAGLALGIRDSIVVDDRMETSVPGIFAVGDAVEVRHFVTGQKTLLSLAGPANRQGRIAADNICGLESRYVGSQGSTVLKVFDMTIAATGISERMAQAVGLSCDSVVLSPGSHAGYYPGSRVMTMKVIFERDTFQLLGAQIAGYEGVDKRIDVLATAIHAEMNALELKNLDLAYAPPFSSARDPVNVAGLLIDNLAQGLVRQFRWNEVDFLPRDGSMTLLDVRTPQEYEAGHVEGFVNIPLDSLRERLSELSISRPVRVMCQSGLRSYLACRILSQNGYNCSHLSGGYRFYSTVREDRLASGQPWPCGGESGIEFAPEYGPAYEVEDGPDAELY